MKASIRNTEIYYDIAGMQLVPTKNGLLERPVIFLVHGGPGGDHLRFKQHSLELQEVAQLVFIDQRGCGRSKKTRTADYTLENNIEDIEALRIHLGLDKIYLLGTSYGGIVAQGYAIRYPKRVAKLILVATAPSGETIEEAKQILAERGTSEQIAISEHLWQGSFKNPAHVEKFFQLMEPMYSYLAAKSKPSKKPAAKSTMTWSHQALNQGFGDFLRHYNFVPKLKRISCPTLVLAGQQDWICNANQSKIIAEHIPNAKLKIFKNCGHSIAIDAHEAYIKAIKQFLKG